MSGPIDYVLIGKVRTLDSESTVAEAMAVSGDRIQAIGTRADILRARSSKTEVIETNATIIPGFNDTHAHMDTEGLRDEFHPLGLVRSIDDVLKRISGIARQTPPGSWIVTMPIGDPPFYFGGPSVLAEGRMPTAAELDHAAPDNPVCILPPSGYWSLLPCYTALNSRGLALNNLDRHSAPRVSGIELLRDANGDLTGVILENNYPDSVQIDLLPAVPRVSIDQRRQAVLRSMAAYHSKGTTSVYEGHGSAPDIISIYRDLWESKELTMRMGLVVSPAWSSIKDAARLMRESLVLARGQGFGDAMLRVGGIFISYGGDRAAAQVSQEKPWDLGWSCFVKQANEPQEFEELCLFAVEHDLRVHTIVIDKLDEILPILERVNARFPLAHRRWVLEHMSVANEADLARLKPLGVGVTLIPNYHLWKVGARFFDLPDEKRQLVSPVAQLKKLGVPVAAGTDNSPYDPLAVVRSMMTRSERTTGKVLGASACIDAETALRTMTVDGAWFTFEENGKGPLVPGNYADLAILSEDPIQTPAERLDGIACRATMVGGRFVHWAM